MNNLTLKKKILIIDDDVTLSNQIELSLNDDYDVCVKNSLKEAKYIFMGDEIYDCVVIDLDMGSNDREYIEELGVELSGWVFLKKFLLTKYQKNKIIIFSTHIDELKANVNEEEYNEITFLDKNNSLIISANELLNLIKNILMG